jgi:hypothetical protein
MPTFIYIIYIHTYIHVCVLITMATNKYPTKSYMIMVDNNCRIGWDMHGHSHLPIVGYSWKPRERKGISTLFMGGGVPIVLI